MKPNRSAFETDKPAKGTKPATIAPNASSIQEQPNRSAGNFYRVAHAGPFIFASNNPADGFMFNRPGHPVQVFHAKGKQCAMIQAREHAQKNTKAHPLNWRKTLTT